MWSGDDIHVCCGKYICTGCAIATREEMKEGNMKRLCIFCRVPIAREDSLQQYEKRMSLGDAEAFNMLGTQYHNGDITGIPQDRNKALELWNKAAELGSCKANYILGDMYNSGESVERDNSKCIHHTTLAAIGGHEEARYNLGIIERDIIGNMGRSKHYIIAARCGHDKSLKNVKEGYKAGLVKKDEYASTLRAYQFSANEMISEQRTKAAAQYYD